MPACSQAVANTSGLSLPSQDTFSGELVIAFRSGRLTQEVASEPERYVIRRLLFAGGAFIFAYLPVIWE
jgi:hypothetical protein